MITLSSIVTARLWVVSLERTHPNLIILNPEGLRPEARRLRHVTGLVDLKTVGDSIRRNTHEIEPRQMEADDIWITVHEVQVLITLPPRLGLRALRPIHSRTDQ